ncbi:MAG: hypothetical protein EOR00_31000 [Mesorhizobium sp.]|uniref:hypothetical protein n=1 Tax=Mesorhizobium sp. TaxID=1871066 RepID=UPI000FE4B2C9|nr:hypothetical protein [Mesorhizobium sp.]RWP10342.1 MAG: hypothetical protein EOR00_31000 [Mesorhizobium sp.]
MQATDEAVPDCIHGEGRKGTSMFDASTLHAIDSLAGRLKCSPATLRVVAEVGRLSGFDVTLPH